ncbi:MAG: class II glutamine amidotransferase [Candidatus Wallbacteria bacterium]|nr:class II glutamine amidotransferase [Candidatus Wallbacteria bacterium]
MCRMIMALGDFDPGPVVDGLLLMASDQNEKHECNRCCKGGQGSFTHRDGWGALEYDGRDFKITRSDLFCVEDSSINALKSDYSRLLVLHARKHSSGTRAIPDPHPFLKTINGQDFFFCHNGTVWDDLNDARAFEPDGDTDSERLFSVLLKGYLDQGLTGLKRRLWELREFSGASFFFGSRDFACACTYYNMDRSTIRLKPPTPRPSYYTLKTANTGNAIFISSETVPMPKVSEWNRLERGRIVIIDQENLSCRLEQIY